MYIYSELFLLTMLPIFTTTLGIPIVTRKSYNNRIVLAAITILYVFSVVGGIFTWIQLRLLVGMGGKTLKESVLVAVIAAQGTTASILEFVPLIVADGLLVRHLCHAFDFSYIL